MLFGSGPLGDSGGSAGSGHYGCELGRPGRLGWEATHQPRGRGSPVAGAVGPPSEGKRHGLPDVEGSDGRGAGAKSQEYLTGGRAKVSKFGRLDQIAWKGDGGSHTCPLRLLVSLVYGKLAIAELSS